MTTDDHAKRLIDLESKLLMLEHDFEALNRAFIERGDELIRQQRQIDRLTDQVEQGGGGEEPRSLEENKPPHY